MYDLEIEKVISAINENKAKTVLLQLPDGIKHKSKIIVEIIKKETNASCIIWLGACFGACDIPITIRHKIDLLIQFGHNKFNKNPEGWE